ncbi:hypothetical protein [Stackebrandtia nassauensis]|nr:hypothetical protein [Stackebrandtia nassauensis]
MPNADEDPVPLTVLGPSALENAWTDHGRGTGFAYAAAAVGGAAALGVITAASPGLSIPWQGRAALLAGAIALTVVAGYLLLLSRRGFQDAKRLAATTTRVQELIVGDTIEVHYLSGRVRTIRLADADFELQTFNTGSPARQKCELIAVDTDGEIIGLPLWDKPRPTSVNLGDSLAFHGPSIRKIDRDLDQLILALSKCSQPSAANVIEYLRSLMEARPTWRGWVRGKRSFGQWLGDQLSH